MSKSASLPKYPIDSSSPADTQSREPGTAAWKQEVNERLAAHRTRRGMQDSGADRAAESPKAASARAAEAAARVAARYAKAPSYSQLLAGEARAAVRAAGAAAQAARHAQAAAEAVLAGLESAPEDSGLWEPANLAQAGPTIVQDNHGQDSHRQDSHRQDNHRQEMPPIAEPKWEEAVSPAPYAEAPVVSRWQDEAPAAEAVAAHAEQASPRISAPPRISEPWAGAQPRWEEALPVHTAPNRDEWSEMRVHPSSDYSRQDYSRQDYHDPRQNAAPSYASSYGHVAEEPELFPYDTAGSHDPVAGATIEPVQHIPANLIEFPRELVATRKARPRLAEGPYYEASQSPQLNIFEVDPEQLAAPVYAQDAAGLAVAPPEWASIELDHHPELKSHAEYQEQAYDHGVEAQLAAAHDRNAESMQVKAAVAHYAPAEAMAYAAASVSMPLTAPAAPAPEKKQAAVPAEANAPAAELMVAPLSDRMLATVVDGALITLAFLAAAVVVIAATTHPPTGRTALIASGCGLLLFWSLYQFLFLSYAEEGTPGMRYARIALCTFGDDNPTVEQMRMRIPAILLATIPAGLGLLWSAFDGDHLGWHDRLTKTYQRKY